MKCDINVSGIGLGTKIGDKYPPLTKSS